jgi:hypothetical protein
VKERAPLNASSAELNTVRSEVFVQSSLKGHDADTEFHENLFIITCYIHDGKQPLAGFRRNTGLAPSVRAAFISKGKQ